MEDLQVEVARLKHMRLVQMALDKFIALAEAVRFEEAEAIRDAFTRFVELRDALDAVLVHKPATLRSDFEWVWAERSRVVAHSRRIATHTDPRAIEQFVDLMRLF